MNFLMLWFTLTDSLNYNTDVPIHSEVQPTTSDFVFTMT